MLLKMRILVMAVVALAVLTMASGGSTLGWQGTESEFGREDRSWSLSSFGDTVKKIWNNLLQNFISFMLRLFSLPV